MFEVYNFDRVAALIERQEAGELLSIRLRDRTNQGATEQPIGKLALDEPDQLVDFIREEEEGWKGTVNAIKRWIKSQGQAHCSKALEASGQFKTIIRVFACGHKGTDLGSTQFALIKTDLNDTQVAPLKMPTFPEPELTVDEENFELVVQQTAIGDVVALYSAMARTMLDNSQRAMGTVTNQVLSSAQRTQEMTLSIVDRLETSNNRLTETVEKLTEQMVEKKRLDQDLQQKQLESELKAVRDERNEIRKSRMINTAGSTVKELVETAMIGSTMSPEMKEMLPFLKDPEIQKVFASPELKEALKNPTKRKFMFEALHHLSKQFVAKPES